MSDLLTRIENLSPARRKLLERMSANKERERRTYPLSYAQRGMWFLDQLEPNSVLYSMPFGLRLSGRLDEEVVWKVIREIVRRHESLSTVFSQRNGVAVQEVVPGMQHPMETIDLGHVPEHRRDDEVRRLVNRETLKPFNLSEGPLFRVTLFKLSESENALLFNMHHIVSDGWSAGILEQEFDALYKAFAAGEPSPLPELELQYGDYAVWQRGWLQSGAMQKHLEYWRTQLAEVAAVVLPTDQPRPSMLTHRGKTVEFPLSTELHAALKAFCRGEGITLFMAVLAALQLALARYTGVKDFAIGTPVANRNRLETEGLIGCFINTLVLRTNLQRRLTFKQLLAAVKETTLGAYEHQDMPFEKLVEELVPVQSLRWTPLFQVLLVLLNFPAKDSELSELTRTRVDTGLDMAKIELALTVVERDGALLGSLQYDADLYERKRMQRLMEHFCLVLERMVTHPDEEIWQSSLLPRSERDEVLNEWNQTAADYPREKPLHALVEDQAERTPDAPAVLLGEAQLTYRELNQSANRLAHYLRSCGIEPESRVGVCMQRSPEMFVALLAVLKAGGVYVPLDPAYPADRLQFIAGDAALKALIVHDSSPEVAPAESVQLLNISRAWSSEQQPDHNPDAINAPENLAYVIYTSGSTGQPKGVGISHQSACNQLWWSRQAFQLSAADRFLQKASISFDSSIEEIFAPLSAGACIVAARPQGEQDIEYLADLVSRMGVTCIDLPPSLLQAFIEHADPPAWRSVRLFISGGETLRAELVKAFHEKFSGTLLNTYGPTEATVQAAWADGLDHKENIPIGRPVANTQLYVLDEDCEPVPGGVAGELYIGGAGLARGYLNRPELTAEKFVPNPFSAAGGERLYRTGDLVKWRGDGKLDFVGRTDYQVKVRGYRIELGEIETALESHSLIRQAVVLVREDEPGAKRLVAYVVKSSEAPLSITTLREYLRERLPDYMVPGTWVELESLPLSANGKIDRKALPSPDGRSTGEEYVRPRNHTEEILAGFWEAVLKQESVSVEANFFDLGGHSLLAMQLISRIRKTFSIDVPLRVLFESPTVSLMAEHIRRQLQLEPVVEIPPMVSADRNGPLPLSFAQQRLWFLDQLVPGSAAYNIPIAVRLIGALDRDAFRESWREVVRRHEALRTRFPQRDGAPVQEIGDPAEWGIEEVDLRTWPPEKAQQDAEVQKMAHEEAETPFDLAAGPLLRVKLLQLEERSFVLLVTMHHIVSDGWSIGIMMRELSELYSAYVNGEDSRLEEPALQYADYAVWQSGWLQGEVLEKQLGYWKKQLANIEPLELPTRSARPELKGSAEVSRGWALSQELSAELKTLGRKQGTTLFMTLLAAFQVLLSRYSGQQDIVVGTPIAGRRWQETHGLVGFFVNTLVLRTNLTGDPSFTELLGRVRETTLEAYAHQDVPFEKLVEELRPERDLSRQPFFQVMFALQHTDNSGIPLSGLEISGLNLEANRRTAKFDLMLGVEEVDGRVQGSFEFNQDLFDPAMMDTMAAHWQIVLEQLVKESGRPISRASLQTERQQVNVPALWSGSPVQDPGPNNVAGQIARHAEQRPQAIAVSGIEAEISYSALNRQANQWANYLIGQGITPGTRVGVGLGRGLDLVPALLGVLKAGAVIVGLEPNDPPLRTIYRLRRSDARVVITSTQVAAVLSQAEVRFLLPEELAAQLSQESSLDPNVVIEAAGPACIVFRPDRLGELFGVAIPHRTLCLRESGNPDRGESVALACTFEHEAATIEMFRCLSRGDRLVSVPVLPRLSPRQLAGLLRDRKPTALWISAGALEPLAREFPWALKNIQRIFCEDTLVDLSQLRAKIKTEVSQRMHGVLGYAEAGGPLFVYPSASFAEGARSEQHLAPGVRLYLLDSAMQPAVPGVLGEFFVGGDSVALGYDGNPKQDVPSFVADPFNKSAQTRMYRTGDWARLHPNGTVEYRGRRDGLAIKGGVRLHPGEIESALLQYEGIGQAAVNVSSSSPAGKSGLAALVVAAEGQTISDHDLRVFLVQKLPQAMVPATITQVERLIRTPQGKVVFDHTVFVAPRNAIELEIAQIWKELLRIEEIGVHDDFFRLGGHSLLAIRLKTMLHERLQWDMPLADLFRASTVAGLAALMTQQGESQQSSREVLVEVQTGGALTPMFFVHPVGGSVLSYVELARELGPEQPFYALQSPLAGAAPDPIASFEQMAALYIREIRRVKPAGPYLLGGWSLGGLLAWEIAQQLSAAGQEIGMLALIDSYPPDSTGSESDSAVLALFAEDMARMSGGTSPEESEHFRRLAPEQRLTFVQDALARRGIVPGDRAQEETAALLEVFTRNVRAMENYRLASLDQHVTLVAASEASAPERLAAEWQRWARGGVSFTLVPGDHYTMMKQPSVSKIVEALRRGIVESTQNDSFALAGPLEP